MEIPKRVAASVDRFRRQVAAAAKSEKVKVPFACRLCGFVGADIAALEAHRKTPLHMITTKVWRDRSACRLCRVQTTSPNELAVHLTSKKHKERLAQVNAART